ncbi:MAG: hypothetical protein LBI13_06455 [Streptococcaceae bacterium]|jgi:hypothetical protein|nr:hypothetical protein [Streptococcaceae bacterium]
MSETNTEETQKNNNYTQPTKPVPPKHTQDTILKEGLPKFYSSSKSIKPIPPKQTQDTIKHGLDSDKIEHK